MFVQGKQYSENVFALCVLLCLLLSQQVQSKLCTNHLRSFYREKRDPRINQTVKILFNWLSVGTNGSYPRPYHNDESSSDFFSALLDLQPPPASSQLAYSNLLQTIHDLATYRRADCASESLDKPKLHRVASTILKFRQLLKNEGHSVKIREDFGYLFCLAFRFGVIGPPLKQALDTNQMDVFDALNDFFTSVMHDPTLLAQIVGVSIPLPSFGLVTSLHSSQQHLNYLKTMAQDLVDAAEGLVHFFLLKTTDDTSGPSKHRLDNSARIAVFLDRINEYSSIPVNSSECAEPGFTALLDVIEQSRLHSTIVLVTGAPPSDPDMFELVLNLAIIKNIKIYILFNESVCSGDLQMYKVLAQATGGRILDSLDSFVEFYTFRESSNVSGALKGAVINTTQDPLYRYCRSFTVTTFDDEVLLAFFSKKDQNVLLVAPDQQISSYRMNPYLNLTVTNSTPGRWMACAEEKFKLLLMFPQMYDSSVEYLRSDKGRFVVQTEAAGCNKHKIIIHSPRHNLIGSTCPLRLELVQRNGTIYDKIKLYNCGPFLEARISLAPMPLSFRISACDKLGNRFTKSLLAPFFKPSVAVVSMRRSQSSKTSKRHVELYSNEIVTVHYLVVSSEVEEIKVTFKILKKVKNLRIKQFPSDLAIPPGGRSLVSFTYDIGRIPSSSRGRVRFIAKVVTQSRDVKFSCAYWERFVLKKGRNKCGCLNGGSCMRTISKDVQVEDKQCLCTPLFTGQFCQIRIITGQASCLKGCRFGTCVADNTCRCQSGYKGDTCDTPICTQMCLNGGLCRSPNNCTCVEGFAGDSCEIPICFQPCQNNGSCIAPNTCECAEGYSGPICDTPLCSGGCENGNCTSPNTCTCTLGYTGRTCGSPVCTKPCLNGGTCVAPDTCACAEGFQGQTCDSKDLPQCSPSCKNGGTCDEKDTCQCVAGYTGNSCETPICVRKCFNGGCTAPDTCTCHPGYRGGRCNTPVCSEPCVNGRCTSPDICTCESGYAGPTCDTPLCSNACVNGMCTAPDTCTCDAGYAGRRCNRPICSQQCVNGQCTAPETCTCDAGYTGDVCDAPFCSNPCLNGGTCSDVDNCSCLPEYTGNQCETPVCSPMCVNGGVCIKGRICQCQQGYTGDSCEIPECTEPCLNGGTCVAPDTCACAEGFQGQTCESKDLPQCSPSCKNGGTCMEKDTCQCAAGYTGRSCETPICVRECFNGECTAPDTCTCHPGYGGGRCKTPVCSDPCVNGRCTSPDICTCESGYAGPTCDTPLCSNACVNGRCTAPDTCTCDAGYAGRRCNRPICSQQCVNGQCTEPETCTCDAGYTGDVCDAPFCSNPCLNGGTCSDVDTCSCLPEYTGNQCETPVCSSMCMNGGMCIKGGICQCQQGYTGDSCEIPLCSPPCLNGGVCSQDRTCNCPSSSSIYTGNVCQNRICSDYVYYFGFLDNIRSSRYPKKILIYSQEDESVSVSVWRPKTGLSTIEIEPSASIVINVNFGENGYVITTDSENDKGFQVEAVDKKRIKVILVNENIGSIGVVPLMPTVFYTSGPYTFYAVSVEPSVVADVESVVLLVGTANNTTVTMTAPYAKVFLGGLRRANVPFQFRIDEGETILLSDVRDLTGTVFQSSQWLTFISGHECGNVPRNRQFCDHLAKQLPPTLSWGTRFVVAYFETRTSGYVIKMVASQPNTNVLITFWPASGSSTMQSVTLSQSGSHRLINIPDKTDCTVEASSTILLVQFAKGEGSDDKDLGDPCMLVVPHTEQYVSRVKATTISSHLSRDNVVHSVNLIVEEDWAQFDLISLSGTSFEDLGVVARWVEFSPSERYAIVSYNLPTKGIYSVQHNNSNAKMSTMSYGFESDWAYCYSSVNEALSCSTTPRP